MGLSPKIIYNCDHSIEDIEMTYGDILMVRNEEKGFPDKVVSNIEILRIDEILNYDKTFEFSPGIDYEQKTSKNIIEWLNSSTAPKPGSEYYIRGAFNRIVIKKSNSDLCERCNGNGWYTDIFGSNQTNHVIGINKLSQDFIKTLFTIKQENGYGSNISDAVGKNVNSTSDLSLYITSAISDVENQILNKQLEQINNGATVPLSEALDKVEVTDIIFVRQECVCYISVRIFNKNGDSIPFSLKSN